MLSYGSYFHNIKNWLADGGQGTKYHIGDYNGDNRDDILFDFQDSIITMQDPCWSLAKEHEGYTMDKITWIENAKELLDDPGEWYHDETSSYIYYIPLSGENLSNASVIVPTTETLVQATGTLSSTNNPTFVHNIHFYGITFSYGTWLSPSTTLGYPEVQAGWHYTGTNSFQRTPGNVDFSRVKNIRFERCTFSHLGAAGLNIDSGSQENIIIGNKFYDISSSAIQIGGDNPSTTQESLKMKNNTISNNYISNVAVEYQSATGIFCGYNAGLLIEHNELEQLPYTGISVGWGWGTDSYARDNQLNANLIHDVMLNLIDGGGIYTLSAQPNSSITENYIHDVGNNLQDQEILIFNGIYHDTGSRYFTDTANVVSNVEFVLSIWSDSSMRDNTVTGNYFDIDWAFCNKLPGKTSRCNFNNNSVINNVFTGGIWPSKAQVIMNNAGLESNYKDIK